ncbi:MAG: cell division topological specificity factor MinE [Eubacteriaceae bacterium]|jgi:cell division topological specificity factor|nr:cell division topological specificity factor MinE [Eubacteriaceae bacterium]
MQRARDDSKAVAKERLKNILMRDRVDISAEYMNLLKDDLIATVSDYFNIRAGGSEIYLTSMKKANSQENESVLVCLIPVNKRSAP